MRNALDIETAIDSPLRQAIHDLRNLFGIVASAARLLGDAPDADEQRRLVTAIEDAALRGGERTSQLLAASPPSPALFDLNQRLRRLAPMLAALTGARLKVTLDLGSSPAWVRLDPDALEATVLELVINARAACREDGSITVRSRVAGDRLWLLVADTGAGMDAGTLDRVLGARPASIHGSGLMRARAFVARAHGGFRVRSRPHAGTVVGIDLAVAAPPAAGARIAPGAPPFHKQEPNHEDRQPIAA